MGAGQALGRAKELLPGETAGEFEAAAATATATATAEEETEESSE